MNVYNQLKEFRGCASVPLGNKKLANLCLLLGDFKASEMNIGDLSA